MKTKNDQDRTVVPRAEGDVPAPAPSARSGTIAEFLEAARQAPPAAGRLLFALDATFSRQPTWDLACRLQGEMFNAVGGAGDLSVQLAYYRGFGECRASRWVRDAEALRDLMTRIDCRGGQSQIARVLRHALKARGEAGAPLTVVFIGDAVEEDADHLCALAGELGMRGVRCFLFQEGRDANVERVFREMARLTGGAWCRFGPGADAELADLLRSVAVLATRGRAALEAQGGRGARLLLGRMGKD